MFQWPWNRKKKEAPAGRGEVVEPAPPVWEPLEEKNMTPDGPLPFGYKIG